MSDTWDGQITAALTAYGRDGALAEARLLSLSENATYLCTFTDTPDPLVLRLHRPGFRSLPQIRSELMWIERLRADGAVATPAVVPTPAGEPAASFRGPDGVLQHAALFEFAPGAEPDTTDFADVMEVVGRETAALHEHASRWRRPATFVRPDWDLDNLIGAASLWGRWSDNPDVSPGDAEVLARAEEKLTRELDAYGRSPAVFGLIHGDLRAANLLVATDAVRLIDFDDCGSGWFLYDLACSLSFVEHDPRAAQWVASWLRGYESRRALREEDVRAVPALVMLRRLMLVAWVHKRGDTPFAASLRPAFAAQSARLARRYLADDYLTAVRHEHRA
ncbi:phosphotransferase enzyme family protein [Streptomyces sp. NBC_00582]|uniref:phosphotransferase enzyme family protein n=1 Tax=Streptomyces sp. NBC_00582 TaxID=2975783 RepID=UPI002E81657D|nr:phosphotransferase [Streptomyces sp. NBC_00582]WUB59008.1 phosphotransferase [Streptomyces sp. NBC_00582]WUB67720.1 phosphotransferase [Streptomyces sp. NBC_00582]